MVIYVKIVPDNGRDTSAGLVGTWWRKGDTFRLPANSADRNPTGLLPMTQATYNALTA
jgi:hypothetical protein